MFSSANIEYFCFSMSKVLKIVGQSLGIVLECLLAFLIIFLFVVRSSFVQTYIANQVTQYLSNELKTTVKVDKVDVIFFDRLAIDGLLIKDQTKDRKLKQAMNYIDRVVREHREINGDFFAKKL